MKYIVGGAPTVTTIAAVPDQLQRDQPRRGVRGRLAGRRRLQLGDADDARGVQLAGSVDHPAVHRSGRAHGAGRPPQAGAGRGRRCRRPPCPPSRRSSAPARRRPSAAGIATLIRSAAPSADRSSQCPRHHDQPGVRARLPELATASPTTDCGSGFIMADRWCASLDSTPPTVSGAAEPGGTERRQRLVHRAGQRDLDGRRRADGGLRRRPAALPGLTARRDARRSPAPPRASAAPATGSVTVKRDSTAPTRLEVPRDSRRPTRTARSRSRRRSSARPRTPSPASSSCKIKRLKHHAGQAHGDGHRHQRRRSRQRTKKFSYTIL